MGYKSNELFGAADKVVEFMTNNAALIDAKGVSSAGFRGAVEAAKADTVTKEDTQEEKKVQLRAATEAYEAAAGTLYDTMTSVIDVCAGALGKKTAKAKQILAIRKQLNKSKTGTGDVTPGTS